MDDIQKRLQETSQACLKAYENWRDKRKDASAQEEPHSAIHELRKVASRLEIELAVSERKEMTSKPLPIPSRRSSKEAVRDDDDGDTGNAMPGMDRPQPDFSSPKPQQQRRRPHGQRSQES